MNYHSIPFIYHSSPCIHFAMSPSLHLRAEGATPAKEGLLVRSDIDFGIKVNSILDSSDIQSFLEIFGNLVRVGLDVQCAGLNLKSENTLYFTDPCTVGELDGMTLEYIPFDYKI